MAAIARSSAYRLAFGDIHRHSRVSDGVDDPELHFAVARRKGLDFYALTDHARLTVDPTAHRGRMGPIHGPQGTTEGETLGNLDRILEIHSIDGADWQRLRELVRSYYEPGSFVTFVAYEWSCPRYGDHNVYYRSDDEPLVAPSTLPELYAGLQDDRALVIPHHTAYAKGRRGKDWNHHHPRLERLVEIFSHHGSSETPDGGRWPLRNVGMGASVRGGSVEDALLRGYKLGFVGGSDAHAGADVPWVLTGVYTRELTREAVFEALWNRRCFATSGPRIALDFSLDGLPMGSIVAIDQAPTFDLAVTAPTAIDCVELVRHGSVVAQWSVSRPNFQERWTDDAAPDYPDTFYYLRVLLEDGGAAWSSPIWVSFLPEHPVAAGYLYWQTELPIHFQVKRDDEGARLVVANWAPEGQLLLDLELGIGERSLGTWPRFSPGERVEQHVDGADLDRFWIRYRDEADNVRFVIRSRSTE